MIHALRAMRIVIIDKTGVESVCICIVYRYNLGVDTETAHKET